MNGWQEKQRGTIYDATDNATRKAAAEQRAVAHALESLAPLQTEVIAMIQAMPSKRRRP